ncbi:hypothetical protein [Sphingomonas soli]|uniref:hypothetical protein n=1 Tax=Sphingomonas soli TaxID=266127 RepID=UPI0008332951|nr:hypothetical protein [Sphingomonas soli]
MQDQQRNVDSERIANRPTFVLGSTTLELGAFYNNRLVKHPSLITNRAMIVIRINTTKFPRLLRRHVARPQSTSSRTT